VTVTGRCEDVPRETSVPKNMCYCRLLIKTKYTADNSQIVSTRGTNFWKLSNNKSGEKSIN